MRIEMTEAFRDWFGGLKDVAGRARIQVRIDRLAHGNPGQSRALIILLAGGDKSTQVADVKVAIELARNL